MKLQKPLKLEDKTVNEINLDLENITGEEILKIDLELRAEGHPQGFDNVFNQNVLLKIASKASGLFPEDIKKLRLDDFLEVTFSVRNFLLGSSVQTEEQNDSEESSSN